MSTQITRSTTGKSSAHKAPKCFLTALESSKKRFCPHRPSTSQANKHPTPKASNLSLTNYQMASFVSDSIFAALKTQFEDAMRNLVSSIAEGEGLDVQQLMDKYLVDVIPEAKAKKAKAPAKTRKAKVSVTPIDPDETQEPMPTACSCLTAKGGACKLKPLFGTAMCSIHTKKAEAAAGMPEGAATGPIKRPKKKTAAVIEEPVADSEDDAPRPVAPKKKRAPAKKKAAATDDGAAAGHDDDEAAPSAPKKAKKAKKVKTDAPVHTHELDDEVHDDCELCQTHGCPLEDNEDEYETVMSPPRTLRERLTRAAVISEFVEDDE